MITNLYHLLYYRSHYERCTRKRNILSQDMFSRLEKQYPIFSQDAITAGLIIKEFVVISLMARALFCQRRDNK